ncbi:MAG: hypothetical protein HDT02_00210 [Bacteroidales bacterium]|nr:hypothetical protein [Bacteroidales bacterium]
MKKKIFGIALAALSLVAFNGVAQDNTGNCVSKECAAAKKEMKKDIRQKQNPYEGLNLTDAQKTKLEQLDAKRFEAKQKQMQAAKDEKKARKEERMAKNKARCEARKTAKKDYLEEVKAIIGPDQYVVFLENYYVNSSDRKPSKEFRQGHGKGHGGMAKNKDSKGKKGDKQGKRGEKPSKDNAKNRS